MGIQPQPQAQVGRMMLQIARDRRLVVQRHRRAVLEFLVVAKHLRMIEMIWLPAESCTLLLPTVAPTSSDSP